MTFMQGIIQGEQNDAKLNLENLAYQEGQLKLNVMQQSLFAQAQEKQLWQQFDPKSPGESLAKIASGMGAAGDSAGAMKALSASEAIASKKQAQLNMQSQIASRQQTELLRERAQAEKEKHDTATEAASAAREQRLNASMIASQARAAASEKLAEARLGIMMKGLSLRQDQAAKGNARADEKLNMQKYSAQAKAKKDAVSQAGATQKLREARQKMAIPDTYRTQAATAVVEDDPRLASAPSNSKAAIAKLVAARAGKALADHLTSPEQDWSPEDFDKAVRDQIEIMFKNGEVRQSEPSNFISKWLGQKGPLVIQPGRGSSGTIQPELPKVSSDADYAKLPSGSEFVGPDGIKRRKP